MKRIKKKALNVAAFTLDMIIFLLLFLLPLCVSLGGLFYAVHYFVF